MRIATGYFAMIRQYAPLIPVSIALKTPEFFKGPQYKKVSPTGEILRLYKSGQIGKDEYISMYNRDVLAKLNPQEILSDLEKICREATGCVLLCYEKPGDLCHRHLLAGWLSQNLNMQIEEYPVERKQPKSAQMSLL